MTTKDEHKTKTVLIEYTLSPSADVEDVERHIGDFVAGIRALQIGISYASHRQGGTERGYAHIGRIPDEAALAKLQSAPFFKAFSEYLPTVCSARPRVSWLETVASTQD